METPFDTINAGLGNLREKIKNDPEELFEPTDEAIEIDMELQSKFLFFSIAEELENVVIYKVGDGVLVAGSGYDEARCGSDYSPARMLERAVNALAMYWRLKQKQDAAELRLVRARRPAPGVYEGKAARHFIAVVTEDRRILVQRTDGGFNDSTETYDAMDQDGDRAWKLRRINLTDGTVES